MNGDRMMNFKSQKGSIALFVLIALLFYMGFLLLLYANNLNKVQTISEKIELVKSIYERNIDNIDDVYNRRLAQNDKVQPIIKELPNKVITNVTQISDTYEEYGPKGGKTIYKAFDTEYSSLKALIYGEEGKEGAIAKNQYGNINFEVNAYGNNGLLTTENKQIEIVRGMNVTNETELNTAFATTGDLYVYVANNIECTNPITADNINHKLDLNNCTISYSKVNESFTFINLGANSNLVILDSSSEKNGTVAAKMIDETHVTDGIHRKVTINCIVNNGILTIESGNVLTQLRQSLVAKNDGTAIEDKGTSIENLGTVNVNGGTISTDVYTNAVTYVEVQKSSATAIGIINSGTVNLNSGAIKTNAEASMQKVAAIFGQTYAYSYGVSNNGGTINNSNNVVFTTTATANKTGTYINKADKADIK